MQLVQTRLLVDRFFESYDFSDADRAIVVVRVDDVDAVARSIEGRGGRLLAPPETRFGGALRAAYLRDPEGTLIELQTW